MDMTWKHLFSNTILKRGEAYYRNVDVTPKNQATDRAHRIGQTKAVSVYKLIVKDTIEEKILKMQEEKSALADEILSGHAGGLMRMSRAELLELL